MQQNRLQRQWKILEPEILKKWDRLTKYDLADVSGNYDALVDVIRNAYSPARTKLSIEADVRDWLTSRIDEKEGS
jgi:hypothetical protein